MPLNSSTPSPQNLKHRVFTCLKKLSDRDTLAIATNELESIARTLEPNCFSVFVSCINSTDASDKTPVRKQCVHLLAVLSETHGNAFSPHLSKMLAVIIRRLRDPDSAVRSVCVNTVAALSSHITKPPFSSFLKPLAGALFTEQDPNAQIGAALCLGSAIEANPDPEPEKLAKLLPKLEKLLRCDDFKGKPALLTMIASVIRSGGASGKVALRNLVPCLLGFLSSNDWAARKAAAEALARLAVMESDDLAELKAECLRTLENRRFDKVKVVREVMNQMLEAWKQVPDVSANVSPPSPSQGSSRENEDDGRDPPGSRTSGAAEHMIPPPRVKSYLARRSTSLDNSYATTVRKRSPSKSNNNHASTALAGNLEQNKPFVEISVPNAPSLNRVLENVHKNRDQNFLDRRNNDRTRFSIFETKRALFIKSSDDKVHKSGGLRSESRVTPCFEETQKSTVISNVTGDMHKKGREWEDLSLIRNQLVQIEKQQSSLLDLLQRFMGSSQNGMQSLETRVHGLELALDEISYDLAVTSGRMTRINSSSTSCCVFPGADFWNSMLRRKTEGRLTTPWFSKSGGTQSIHYRDHKNVDAEGFNSLNERFRQLRACEFIVNPLADIQNDSRGNLRLAHQ